MKVRYVAVIIYRAKPDMRKKREAVFPNEHGSNACEAVSHLFANEGAICGGTYTLFPHNMVIFVCLNFYHLNSGERIICL